MFTTPEQFSMMHKTSIDMMHTATVASLAGFEKLATLNMKAARASFEESTEMMKSLLQVKDIKSLSDLTTTSLQPATDKASAYAKHCYEIASETGGELARLVEKQMADGNKQLFAALDSMARNAPAGSEGVVTLVKSAVSAANTAFDQVSRATKQAVEMAEANIAAASKTVSTRTSKKAA
ncbi:MAG: TIGR01841 family phasin [Betaproteobacteria bacterium]|jgi:phasin family protein